MGRCADCGQHFDDSQASCPSCGGTVIPGRVERGLQTLSRPGDTIDGRYRVLKVLGSGASGIVYGVYDSLGDRKLALKVLWDASSGDDPEIKRLRREIKASQLSPCNRLVAIHDLVMVGERPALAMEWVEGVSLKEQIRTEGALPWRRAVDVAAHLLEALAHLHGLGIVHRDVKTGNILVAADGSVKLGDFGLAKGEDLGVSLTETGATLGTPGYMAPEVIRGKEATSVSDLYSVGVVLFEMLTGGLPHRGTSALEIASRQLAEPPPLNLLKKHDVPAWFVRIVARLLERDPGDRFPSAKAALEALTRRSAGFAVARRWRVRAAVASLAVLAAAGAFGLYLWMNAQAPLSLSFHGRTLVARDTDGDVLWSRELPRDIQSAIYGHFGPGGTAVVAAAITWDHHAKTIDMTPEQYNRLFLLDRHGHVVVNWWLSVMNSGFSPHYVVHLSKHRFSKNGRMRLVAQYQHNTWYPAGIQVLNFDSHYTATDGGDYTTLCDIYNSGHISDFAYKDLNGDGVDEIVYTGVNNRLYWADFVAAATLRRPEAYASPRIVSPDSTTDSSMTPLFYRCFSFKPYVYLKLRAVGPSTPLLLSFPTGPRLLLESTGELMDNGAPMPPDAPSTARLDAGLAALCKLRGLKRWDSLLSEANRWSPGARGVYRWIGSLFKAEALMGLGRYDEAIRDLNSTKRTWARDSCPEYYYQYLLDSEFLAGRYHRCLVEVDNLPGVVGMSRFELSRTAAWAAIYGGEPDAVAHYLSGRVMTFETWTPDLFAGICKFVTGDYPAAETIFRGGETRISEPGLWLVRTLIRENRLKEARTLLNRLTADFPSEHIGDSELAAWLQWREGNRSVSFVNQFDTIVDQQRREAKNTVLARALLPLTLAHQAAIHRAAGDAAGARKIQQEAYHLAPASWRPLLQYPVR